MFYNDWAPEDSEIPCTKGEPCDSIQWCPAHANEGQEVRKV